MISRIPIECHAGGNEHLADIRPISGRDSATVLSLPWKCFLNASLVLMPMLMTLLIAPVIVMGMWFGWQSVPLLLGAGLLVVFLAQILWAGSYPEWPVNQSLVWRLRRTCRRRNRAGSGPGEWIETARMVELVPRDNWRQTRLDTAEDVMLIRVTDHGVMMEGDRFRYFFPPASILDAHVESLRPGGCFHRLHFAILTARTEHGPQEFPLAFRDHGWSELRSSRRYRATHQLCERILSIATGSDMSLTNPYAADEWTANSPHVGVAAPKQPNRNPYAAPRIL